jgi:hypothetical protein
MLSWPIPVLLQTQISCAKNTQIIKDRLIFAKSASRIREMLLALCTLLSQGNITEVQSLQTALSLAVINLDYKLLPPAEKSGHKIDTRRFLT